MGRKRVKGKRWGSRIIDLDILFYDNETIDKRNLKIPHPRLPQRRFVLVPLSELAPQLIHPGLNVSVSELLATTKDTQEDPYDGGQRLSDLSLRLRRRATRRHGASHAPAHACRRARALNWAHPVRSVRQAMRPWRVAVSSLHRPLVRRARVAVVASSTA